MKIYLAGPMSGVPDLNRPAFNAKAKEFRDEGHTVLNPASVIAPMREALAEEMEWICLHAEAMAFLPGWERSYGARAEHALAVALGLQMIYPEPAK